MTAMNAPAAMTEPAVMTATGAPAALTAKAAPAAALAVGRPLTVRLGLPPRLREIVRQLGATPPAVSRTPRLRLEIEGMVPPRAAVGIRVFLNAPGAGSDTPISDPHYVGSFTFGEAPTAQGGADGAAGKARGKESFLLDPGRVLAALPPEQRLLEGKDLAVTLIATPLRAGEDLAGTSIPVARIELSVAFESS
ncbi:MAG TPA: hypothetical protein VE075_10740 [Thermoanaerobaculia bacterium]|nr:hypothetical protein [Thermoanaerobaculia bacterium]